MSVCNGSKNHAKVDLMLAPPFEPPFIVILSAAAYLFFTRYSLEGVSANNHASTGNPYDAAMKSSKQLTCEGNLTSAPIERESLADFTHLPFPSTGKVPFPTELTSTSNVGEGKQSLAFLDEFQNGSAEERVDGDVEASVSCDPGPTVSSQIPNEEGNGPYCRAGAVPSRGVSLCLTMNIGTLVPSLL